MILYEIIHIDSKKRYIGQTIDSKPTDRWDDHKRRLVKNCHYNKHLQRAWNKYGESAFQFNIIQNIDKKIELDELEIKYINEDKENLRSYNIRNGGSRGGHIDSTKQKISIKLKLYYTQHPEVKDKIRNQHTGIKLSINTKARMKASRCRGEQHHNVRLTESDVLEIRHLYVPYQMGLLKLANRYQVNKRTILNIIHRKTWTHL